MDLMVTAIGFGPGVVQMVTVLWAVGLERIGWSLCFRLWALNGLAGHCAVGCGPGMDWMVTLL